MIVKFQGRLSFFIMPEDYAKEEEEGDTVVPIFF